MDKLQLDVTDYGNSGLTIREAMLDHGNRFPDKHKRPKYLLWNGQRIWTSDCLPVPQQGVVRAECLSVDSTVRQGFDLKIQDGWIELADGTHIPLLRTWQDERFEDVVEYPFFAKDGFLWTWNVYEMTYPAGQKVEEKWTENAGFWVEANGENERVYHCSHGIASPPDFDSFVYKLTIKPK